MQVHDLLVLSQVVDFGQLLTGQRTGAVIGRSLGETVGALFAKR